MNCVLHSAVSSPPPSEDAIAQCKAAERLRLMHAAGLIEKPVEHYRRPVERPFTAEERERVTILFGGFTWKHERLIEAILSGSGYRCQMLPTPDVAAFTIGKEYGNNGQCNPTYFTIGNLIKFLQSLEDQGLSRQEIVDRYIFFTAGSCGPCRFGMYESEYRLALDNAGFERFRIVLYQAEQAIKAAKDNPACTSRWTSTWARSTCSIWAMFSTTSAIASAPSRPFREAPTGPSKRSSIS